MIDATDSDDDPVSAGTPGSKAMPPWNTGELPELPTRSGRTWLALIGPGLVMGASAIGGGEWLVGPLVTAKYGGALLWLATLSILAQGLYNTEVSRYTLYTGEPIFTGKFRTMPGPGFWIVIYLLLDIGSIFPYLAANAATPVAVMLLGGQMPDPENVARDWWMIKIISSAILLLTLLLLIVGGKVYNSVKIVMTSKLVIVIGFLLVLAIFYSHGSTWSEIFSGFFKFGNVPVERVEDINGNGVLDPGEHWDGEVTENLFVALFTRGELPDIDFTFIALIAALAAIAGNGGLSNTATSNYTRDQGWGMGSHVGAIPSLVGGKGITLSHSGTVFAVNDESLPRWKRWYRYVARDQLVMWMPACFIGVALPSMLSVQFLERGTEADRWTASAMTAEGVGEQVANPPDGVLATQLGLSEIASGEAWGNLFWGLTLLCGFLVLAPSMVPAVDGIVRRWVDAFWTSSARLRRMEPGAIKRVYFGVLVVYAVFGLIMLWANKPTGLLEIATLGYNFALGFSCLHTLAVNSILLPRPLRPGWFVRIGLVLSGLFFLCLGSIVVYQKFAA